MKSILVNLILFVLPSIVYAQSGCSYRGNYLFNGITYKVYKTSDSLVTEKFLHQVNALDLSDKKVALPMEIFDLDRLIYLNLRNKNLHSLPEEICKLQGLKVLFLDENHLKELPECLFDMQSLELISIMGCNMDSVTREFSNLKSLRYFAIGGNKYARDDIDFIKEKLPNCHILESVD